MSQDSKISSINPQFVKAPMPGMPQGASAALAVKGNSTRPAQGDSSLGFPMSLAGILIAILTALMAFDNEMSKQNYEVNAFMAKTMAGIGDDGQYKPNTGLVASYMNAALASGEDAKKSIQRQAIGSMIGAGIGAATFVGMGVHSLRTASQINSLKTELKNTGALKDLVGPSAREGGNQAGPAGQGAADSPRLTALKDGKDLEYRPHDTSSSDAIDHTRGTKEAVEQLKLDSKAHAAVEKKIESRIKELEFDLQGHHQRDNNMFTQLSIVEQTGSKAFDGLFKFNASSYEAAKANDDASSQIRKQTSEQVSSSTNDAAQKGNAYHNAAQEVAASLGNLLTSITHA